MKPLEYLTASIEGQPKTWERTGSDRKGRRFNPRGYQTWKDRAAVRFASAAQLRRFPGEVAVAIDLFPDRVDVQVSAIEDADARRPGTGLRGDVDNYAKAVLDALQAAGTVPNDVKVADLRVRIRREP